MWSKACSWGLCRESNRFQTDLLPPAQQALSQGLPCAPRPRLRPLSHLPPPLSPFSSRQSRARRLTPGVWGRAGSGSGSRPAGSEQGRPSGRRPKGLSAPRPGPASPAPQCPAAPHPRPQPLLPEPVALLAPTCPHPQLPKELLAPSLQEVPAGLVPVPPEDRGCCSTRVLSGGLPAHGARRRLLQLRDSLEGAAGRGSLGETSPGR